MAAPAITYMYRIYLVMRYVLWHRLLLHTVQYLPGHGIHLVAAPTITFRYSIYMVMGYILLQRMPLHICTVSICSRDTSCGSACHYIQVQYLPGHGIHLVAAPAITHRNSIYLVMGYLLWQRMPLHILCSIYLVAGYVSWQRV